MSKKVIYEKRDEIAYVTLNRPEKLNCIDLETDDLLYEAWSDFVNDPDVRVAILSGNGEKAFCSGADLNDHTDPWVNAGPSLGRDVLDKGFAGRITRGLHRTNKPIIGALHGWVTGGGLELALACDLRVAADDARFACFHIRRGMHFGDGGIVRLVNTCGVAAAMEMELTGEPVDAQRAYDMGLVNRVVPRDQVMPTAEALAAAILRNPRRGVESAKETIWEVVGRRRDDALQIECLYSYSIMGDPEIIERRDAFLEGRQA